uniref:Methyltransferase n=1 Tax=Ascaris lumbricoides TaxID=6252 RepID=A0A0M3I001_ASCLU
MAAEAISGETVDERRVLEACLAKQRREFVNSNASLFRNTTVVELGAGATGIPGIVASKCGAELVILTEHPHNQQALDLLKLNCIRNALRDSSFLVQGLDWESIPAIDSLLDQLHHLDFILAADVFYDPKVFESLVAAIAHIVDRFTSAQCFFTYEERELVCRFSFLHVVKLHISREIAYFVVFGDR